MSLNSRVQLTEAIFFKSVKERPEVNLEHS